MSEKWIAKRTLQFDSSGIRRVFDLASQLDKPINLSIGQPDFDVPKPVKESMIQAIQDGRNGYSPTQGIGPLRESVQAKVDKQFGHEDRSAFICSGTSGGLVLSMLSLVNPGDEVIMFDPYFVMYKSLVHLAGGVPIIIDTAPDFQVDLDKVRDAISPKTKAILFNSPSNPTGVVASPQIIQGIAELAAEKEVALISDEIYCEFCYDSPFVSPAEFNPETIVIDGFSKTYAMTGWRLGFVHGPRELMETMLKIQQYTFVCAPQPAQWAGLAALEFDMSGHIDDYRRKRNFVVENLAPSYELTHPDGAFYAFPKIPSGTGDEFIQRAVANNLLVIPGNVFSGNDTHFRISFAASDETLAQGIDVLNKMAK